MHKAQLETCRIHVQRSEVPRAHFDRIDHSGNTEWGPDGSLQGRDCATSKILACLRRGECYVKSVSHRVGNIWFIYCRVTLSLELFYKLRDCFEEIRYQSNVCYLEYGSVRVLYGYNHIRTWGKYVVRKEFTLFIATMSFESFIPARCWIAPEMPTAT